MSQTPFSGVFETPDGDLVDMASGLTINPADIKSRMKPFYGVFVDKDGNEHRLDSMSNNDDGLSLRVEALEAQVAVLEKFCEQVMFISPLVAE